MICGGTTLLCSIAEATPSALPPLCVSDDSPVFRGQLRLLDFSVLCDLYLCVFVGHLSATFNVISSSLLHRSIVLLLFGSPLPSVPYLDEPREAQPLPRCQGITIYHDRLWASICSNRSRTEGFANFLASSR